MLIIALVMAVIGLAALVTAVVTSNEVIAWVCIGASVIGVLLLIIDAVRERSGRNAGPSTGSDTAADATAAEPATVADNEFDAEYPEDGDLPDADGDDDAGAESVAEEPAVDETAVIPAVSDDDGDAARETAARETDVTTDEPGSR
ncbi:hypothetical protein [Mycolicibacterium thermoresistibile]